jgi:hypothetical protein
MSAVMAKQVSPSKRRSRHLCADAGYRGKNALSIIVAHGYTPNVVGRKSDVDQMKRDLKKKAGRWVVGACHGWFTPSRNLLVRYEKLSTPSSR